MIFIRFEQEILRDSYVPMIDLCRYSHALFQMNNHTSVNDKIVIE